MTNLRDLILSKLNESLSPKRGRKKPLKEAAQKPQKALTESKIGDGGSVWRRGQHVLYEGREVVLDEDAKGGLIQARTGRGTPILVSAASLKPVPAKKATKKPLNEWMCAIPSTFVASSSEHKDEFDLTADDLGLLLEDDETGEEDEQEEDEDNGGNVRSNGHTGEYQVDALPKPSDTVSTAYDEDKPTKEKITPLTTLGGAEDAGDPDLGGYDQPGDAPDLPDVRMQSGGNAARVDMPSGKGAKVGDHEGESLVGDSKKDTKSEVQSAQRNDGDSAEDDSSDSDEDKERTDEVAPPGWEGTVKAMKKHKKIDNPYALAWWEKKHGAHPHKKESAKPREKFSFITETPIAPTQAKAPTASKLGALPSPKPSPANRPSTNPNGPAPNPVSAHLAPLASQISSISPNPGTMSEMTELRRRSGIA